MVARDVDDARALARLAQQLLHHVVVRLRPIPARLELPAIDDIADEIDHVGVVVAEELQSFSAWQPLVPRCRSDRNNVRTRVWLRRLRVGKAAV